MILDNTDKTNRNGLIQLLEDETGTQNGTSYPKATKVRDINIALDRFNLLAIKASGRWHVDDTNQTDFAIITTDLISGRQDYSFLNDGSTTPNQILDIYRIEVADSNGVFNEITQIDRDSITQGLSEYKSDGGVPDEYDREGNSIILYTIPNYNYTNGLKMYVARTSSYFLPSDTTKEAGIPNIFHPYLAYHAGYSYASRQILPQTGNRNNKNVAQSGLSVKVLDYEKAISDYYSDRTRDTRKRMTVVNENNR